MKENTGKTEHTTSQEQEQLLETGPVLTGRGIECLYNFMQEVLADENSFFNETLSGIQNAISEQNIQAATVLTDQLKRYSSSIMTVSRNCIELWIADEEKKAALITSSLRAAAAVDGLETQLQHAWATPSPLDAQVVQRPTYMYEYYSLLEHDIFSGGHALGKVEQALDFLGNAVSVGDTEVQDIAFTSLSQVQAGIRKQLAAYDIEHPLPPSLSLETVQEILEEALKNQESTFRYIEVTSGVKGDQGEHISLHLTEQVVARLASDSISCSPTLITQIVSNAISNASKAMQQKEGLLVTDMKIAVTLAIVEGEEPILRVMIEDSGDGFPSSFLTEQQLALKENVVMQLAEVQKGKTEWKEDVAGRKQLGTGRGLASLQGVLADLGIVLRVGNVFSTEKPNEQSGLVVIDFPLVSQE